MVLSCYCRKRLNGLLILVNRSTCQNVLVFLLISSITLSNRLRNNSKRGKLVNHSQVSPRHRASIACNAYSTRRISSRIRCEIDSIGYSCLERVNLVYKI